MKPINMRDVVMTCANARKLVTGLDYSNLISTFDGEIMDRAEICDIIERRFRDFEFSKMESFGVGT